MTDHPILFKPEMVRALLDGRKTQTRRILNPQPPEWATFCQQPQMLNALHEWVPSGLWAWSEPEQNPPQMLRRWPLDKGGKHYWLQPKYSNSDRLWVKETWQGLTFGDYRPTKCEPCEVRYLATDSCADLDADARGYQWRPSIFMPRWASRVALTVTNVRVERLQDISDADAIAEGIQPSEEFTDRYLTPDGNYAVPRVAFKRLWESINAKPRSVKGDDGKVSHYVSYPWDGEPRTETYRGKPHHIHPNPWVAAYTFDVIKGNIDRIGGAA